jgi:hypothetical protein
VLSRITVLVLASLLPIPTGCGTSGSASVKSGPAPASSSSAWKLYRTTDGGYSVELPRAWETVDAAAIADGGGMQQYAPDHPELAAGLAQFQAIAHSPGTLMGVDRSTEGVDLTAQAHFTPNILVRKLDLQAAGVGDAALLDQVLTSGQKNAESLTGNDQPTLIAHFTMAGLPAGSVSYHAQVSRSDGGTNLVQEVDNVVVQNGIAYTLFCTSVASDYARIKPFCDHAVASFALTG